MQWRIQELTACPQVYLELVMITNKKHAIEAYWSRVQTGKYCEAFNEMLRLMAHH